MTDFLNPHSKEAQLARSPGGNRHKAKSPKAKGVALEKAVQASFQATSLKPVRRGFQGGAGGGLSVPDVQAMDGWHLEIKNEKAPRMTAYHKQLKEDCPANKKPGLVYASPLDGRPWIAVELERRMEFAADQIAACGGEVYFP